MAVFVCIPIISEIDYPYFHSVGVRRHFPDNYAAFLQLIEKRKKDLHARGIVTIDVDIDAAGFMHWLGAKKHATHSDLSTYAAIVAK